MSKVVLSLKNLATRYGQIYALKGISLDVCEGEIVTLLGSNGAGKSTTLKTISSLVPACSGKVEFYGKDITNAPPHDIVEMGIIHVPEGRRIFKELNVQENLEMGSFTLKDDAERKRRMDRALELFPVLKERRKQMGGLLSGGEQQMLAIARALMTNPKVLLLDEPSMGLAPMIVDEIFNVIQRLNKEGATILLNEQNAFMALSIANRAYVLETGNITIEGPASDLLTDPRVKEAYLGS